MTIRVAALSRWHVHADEYARAVREHPGANLVAVWDEDAARGADWAAQLGLPFSADYAALLARHDIDAVLVTTPTSAHRAVIEAAAAAGKHVFTEKVLAVGADDARAIAAAVRAADIEFCISLPRQTLGPLRLAKQLIDAGELGRPTLLRIRVAHDGALRDWLPAHFYDAAACGGGAMIDLGAHGMYLSAWLLGTPLKITSLFNHVTGRAVEDNCVSVIEFGGGGLAINETSFVSGGGVFSVEIDGTEGGLRITAPNEPVLVRSAARGDVRRWQPADVPPAQPLPINRWLAGIAARNGPDAGVVRREFGLAAAVQLTDMMVAAYRAHNESRTVSLSEVRIAADSAAGL